MTKRTKIILVFGIIIFLLCAGLVFVYLVFKIAPGAYPYAQSYTINAPENQVVKAINELKLRNPELSVPRDSTLSKFRINWVDGRHATGLHIKGKPQISYEYIVYFYYPQENKILFTWTRPTNQDSSKTEFSFVRFGPPDGEQWIDVNSEFWGSSENDKIIKTFEERILNPIQNIIGKDSTESRH